MQSLYLFVQESIFMTYALMVTRQQSYGCACTLVFNLDKLKFLGIALRLV
jgi:hypothetical protein